MRLITVIFGLAAASLAACGQGEGGDRAARGSAAVEAAMAEGPAPGLWRMTAQIGGMTFPAVETCIEEAKFEAPDALSDDEDMTCTDETFVREGNDMVGHVVCTASNGERTEAEMRVTGDFSRRYTMTMTVRSDPAPDPSMGEMTMISTGERLGDCPAGMAAE